MSQNDFIAISNNSINENLYNEKKSKSTIHQLKKLLKPLLIKMKKNKNTYKKSPEPSFYRDDEQEEIDDNLANELLEQQIFEEIDCCEENAAIRVYQNGHMDIIPVFRGQRYIPVNFARTEAGTFFWTSMVGPDCDLNRSGDVNPITHHQQPELQVPSYKWAQA